MRRPKIASRALDALEAGPMTAWQIAEAAGTNRRGLEAPLQELARMGAIRCAGWRNRGTGAGSGGALKLWELAP